MRSNQRFESLNIIKFELKIKKYSISHCFVVDLQTIKFKYGININGELKFIISVVWKPVFFSLNKNNLYSDQSKLSWKLYCFSKEISLSLSRSSLQLNLINIFLFFSMNSPWNRTTSSSFPNLYNKYFFVHRTRTHCFYYHHYYYNLVCFSHWNAHWNLLHC